LSAAGSLSFTPCVVSVIVSLMSLLDASGTRESLLQW
jgi:hypothetical protein